LQVQIFFFIYAVFIDLEYILFVFIAKQLFLNSLQLLYLGDNCIVFENFTASIGDLIVANWVHWRRVSATSKRIFAIIKSTIDALKFSNTKQLSPF
jgi:hypothetical protein